MYLIKQAEVYLKDGLRKVDVRIVEDRIAEIGGNLELGEGEVEIYGRGKVLLPGAIDIHVHFRDPGHPQKEDFETGSLAALHGGVTTFYDMPNTKPETVDFKSLIIKRELAAKSLVNVKFWIGATYENLDILPELCAEDDVAGVKAYLGSSTGDLLFDDQEYWGKLFAIPNLQVMVHAEMEDIIKANDAKFKTVEDSEIHSVIRSNEAAEKAVRKACEIGFKYNTKLHIAHLSTMEELFVIKEYKEKGYRNLTCEVCPHHLLFHTGDYHKYGNYMKVNPPVRSKEDRTAMWTDGIALGLIDLISSDHAPHLTEEKERLYHQAPSGMPGVQETTCLMLEAVNLGRLTLDDFVRLRSMNPARLFGNIERGVIQKGYYADLMLVDLEADFELKKEDIKSRCGWSNYVGYKGKGKIVTVWCNGKMFDV